MASKPAEFQILKTKDVADSHNNSILKEGNITRNESLKPFGPQRFAN